MAHEFIVKSIHAPRANGHVDKRNRAMSCCHAYRHSPQGCVHVEKTQGNSGNRKQSRAANSKLARAMLIEKVPCNGVENCHEHSSWNHGQA